MRLLIQRVFEAWVKVQGVEFSRTGNGLLVLVGLTHDDSRDVVQFMVPKILNMRLWEKDGKSWNGSVVEIEGDIMVVSQFTLYSILKGNKPDFHGSMQADKARELFDYTVELLKNQYVPERIKTGKFQALMQVGSRINGPVTIEYEKSFEDIGKMGKKKGGQKLEMKKKGSEKSTGSQKKIEEGEMKIEKKVSESIKEEKQQKQE